MTKLSVCIPVYNGEKYIGTTIHSILNQTFKDFELIISDNCSTDNTLSTIKEFSDERIRLIENDEHTPMYPNFNRCLRAARGEYIKFLLADDYFITKTALSRYVDVLDNNNDVGIVSCLAIPVDRNDIFLYGYYGSRLEKHTCKLVSRFLKNSQSTRIVSYDTVSNDNFNESEMSASFLPDTKILGKKLINIIYRSGTDRFCQSPTHTCFRRDLIKDTGLFNEEVSSGWGTETEYWTRILLKSNFYKINYPLVAFRLHPESATESIHKRKRQFIDLFHNYNLILKNCANELTYPSKIIGSLNLNYNVIKQFIRALINREGILFDQISLGIKRGHLFFFLALVLFPAISTIKKCGNDLF
ncbi:MAG: glycosyltransferase family 2 protein [Candidatus Hodarchaeota archaeon]